MNCSTEKSPHPLEKHRYSSNGGASTTHAPTTQHAWKLAEVHDLVGFAYAASKRYRKAETHFRKSIALAPGIVTRHLHLADVLYQVGSEQTAEAYREVLELDPSHAKALHRLKELEAKRSVVDP